MGLGDKFKNLASQAKEAVAEHKDQLHDAVDAASSVADRKTKGKYTVKIAKMNEKAGAAVDKVSAEAERAEAERAEGAEGASAPGESAGATEADGADPTAPAGA